MALQKRDVQILQPASICSPLRATINNAELALDVKSCPARIQFPIVPHQNPRLNPLAQQIQSEAQIKERPDRDGQEADTGRPDRRRGSPVSNPDRGPLEETLSLALDSSLDSLCL